MRRNRIMLKKNSDGITTPLHYRVLVIGQGEGAGQKFKLLPWQKKFIRGAFAANTSTACLSMGRGNGKSTLTAGLALAAFVGPVSQPGASVIVLAASYSQARICFSHLVGFLKATDRVPGKSEAVRCQREFQGSVKS